MSLFGYDLHYVLLWRRSHHLMLSPPKNSLLKPNPCGRLHILLFLLLSTSSLWRPTHVLIYQGRLMVNWRYEDHLLYEAACFGFLLGSVDAFYWSLLMRVVCKYGHSRAWLSGHLVHIDDKWLCEISTKNDDFVAFISVQPLSINFIHCLWRSLPIFVLSHRRPWGIA